MPSSALNTVAAEAFVPALAAVPALVVALVAGVAALVVTPGASLMVSVDASVIGLGGASVFGSVVTPGGSGVCVTAVVDVRVVSTGLAVDAVAVAVLFLTLVGAAVKVIDEHALRGA
jgi:hypothetical protein